MSNQCRLSYRSHPVRALLFNLSISYIEKFFRVIQWEVNETNTHIKNILLSESEQDRINFVTRAHYNDHQGENGQGD